MLFTFDRQCVTQTMLHWDANCATRPACNYRDDEILHILLSCANNRAEFPKLRSTCSARGASHCSVPALLSHLTATKATGKWIDSRNNQRGLQRRTLFTVSFSFEPRCLCLFWQISVFPFKYFGRFRDKVYRWGNKFLTTCSAFDLPFH